MSYLIPVEILSAKALSIGIINKNCNNFWLGSKMYLLLNER